MAIDPGVLSANLFRQKAALQARTVLAGLQRVAGVSHPLLAGVAVASTAVANVPGMSDIYNNWEGIHSRLDNTVKALLNNLATKNKEGWIADDRDAFSDAVERFQQAVESLRGYVKTIASIVDDIGSAFRTYWVTVGEILTVLLSGVAIALGMLATPFAPKGYLLLQMLGQWGATLIAVTTGMLAKAVTGIVAGTSLLLGGKAMIQLYHLAPTGDAAVDFTKARIDTKDLPTYQEPSRPNTLPPHTGFEWVAPKQEKPEPYKP
ncbi:hypothetical protein [Streptosporangium sp. KLBMP 9127]|nr:hypothetical protein [Streptosporangium sp. KLBMP 9127]